MSSALKYILSAIAAIAARTGSPGDIGTASIIQEPKPDPKSFWYIKNGIFNLSIDSLPTSEGKTQVENPKVLIFVLDFSGSMKRYYGQMNAFIADIIRNFPDADNVYIIPFASSIPSEREHPNSDVASYPIKEGKCKNGQDFDISCYTKFNPPLIKVKDILGRNPKAVPTLYMFTDGTSDDQYSAIASDVYDLVTKSGGSVHPIMFGSSAREIKNLGENQRFDSHNFDELRESLFVDGSMSQLQRSGVTVKIKNVEHKNVEHNIQFVRKPGTDGDQYIASIPVTCDITGDIASVTIGGIDIVEHTPPDVNLFENQLNVLTTILADPRNHTLGSIGQHIKTIRKLNTLVSNQDSSNTDRLRRLNVMVDEIIRKIASLKAHTDCSQARGVNVSGGLNLFELIERVSNTLWANAREIRNKTDFKLLNVYFL